MTNRRLSPYELESLFTPLMTEVRGYLATLSGGDDDLHWALRRKLYKELSYDERGKPMHRRKLKELKRAEQNNMCPLCKAPLPEKYVVLDRLEAMGGYSPENTRLLCLACDASVQQSREYR